MQRIYYRDESGQITTADAKDWTPRAYLDAHAELTFADTETLVGWTDPVVDWYAIGGADCRTQRAVGFPVTEHWRLLEQLMYLRKRAGLSPAETGRHQGLSVFALTEMVRHLAVASTEAEATAASAVDAEHAALLADSDAGVDQDWQGERTVWTFADDSRLVVSGPEIHVERSDQTEDA
ncbi:hypothetical protein [Vreelandella utahensis]|uniref:hypothetical protein n=1 Tax=Vreelandella halophila TaxID=86177 RepID=UPI00098620EA|nr:hypothetical protein [Halomonas utahensis]